LVFNRVYRDSKSKKNPLPASFSSWFWEVKAVKKTDFIAIFVILRTIQSTSFLLVMAGINKVILIGNLGKDPEIRYLEGNVARVNFSLATTESFRDKDGNRIEHTEWHNIVFWRSTAESAHKMLKKGMQVYLEGKLQTRQWQDKDGNKRQTTEIVGEHFLMLTKRDSSSASNSNVQNSSSTETNQTTGESTTPQQPDIPF
jgi:single-strand DNA-binding protein